MNMYEHIDNKHYYDEETNKIFNRTEEFAKMLKYIRKEMNISQKDVGQMIGISQQTYASYENAKFEPNLEILVRIADLYKISLDVLLARTTIEKNVNYDTDLADWIDNKNINGENLQSEIMMIKERLKTIEENIKFSK